jgi:Arylsulfatase A and related enzymes
MIVSENFSEFFEELKLFQNTLIIFTADHGESLGEHNHYFAHGDNTYEPTAWVPLIIYHPSLPKERIINNVVELIDIYPTIMDFIGLSAGPQIQGKSLLPLIYNSSYPSEFEYARTVGSWNFGYQTHAIQNKRWKLIYDVNEYWVYFDRIVEDRVRFWNKKRISILIGVEFLKLNSTIWKTILEKQKTSVPPGFL